MIDEKGNAIGYNYDEFNLDNVRNGKFLLEMYRLNPQPNVFKMSKNLV